MVTILASVYDKKTEVYTAPYAFKTKGAAIRWFLDLALNKENPAARHPEDYCLVQVGNWDDDKGTIVPLGNKVHLAEAVEAIKDEIGPDEREKMEYLKLQEKK